MIIKAVYIGDLNYDTMTVFIYNSENNKFEHDLNDEDFSKFSYPVEVIYFDDDWIAFTVAEKMVTKITKEELAKLIHIDFDSIDEEDFK